MRFQFEGTAIDNRPAHGGSWPPRNFVSEFTTMSAPCSDGRSRIGVATVLSTMKRQAHDHGPLAPDLRLSADFPAGLPTLSQKTARVLSSIMRAIASGWSFSRETDGYSLARQKMRQQRMSCAV